MESEEILIRPYGEADYKEIIEIAKSLPEWFTKGGVGHIAVDIPFQRGFVSLFGGTVSGFISFFVYETIAHIGWMGIRPEFHRQGTGRRLVEELTSYLKKSGVNEIRVNTLGDSVEYEPYKRTRAFYRGIGFKDFKVIKQDNPECEELLTMSKKI